MVSDFVYKTFYTNAFGIVGFYLFSFDISIRWYYIDTFKRTAEKNVKE